MQSRRPSGAQRGAQRTASGNMARQGAAPYARPSAANNYPPSQLNIRGASSLPTQVLVANLAQGTSAEDIRQTFLQFGEIIRVKERKRQGDGQAVAFEVLFEDKPAAKKAVEQLDGALADGKILSVNIEGGANVPTAPAAGSAAHGAPPTGPRNGRRGVEAAAAAAAPPAPARRELITPALAAKQAAQAAAAAAVPAVIPRGPRNANGNRVGGGGHQQQVMTARDRKAIAAAAHQGATAAALAAAAGRAGKAATPVGPAVAGNNNKGKAAASSAATPSLASRLGGLPLAQRLGDVKGTTNGAGSDLTNLEAKKTKKAAKVAAAATAAAAATTAGTATASATKKRRRGGGGAGKKGAKPSTATGNGSSGMELD